VPHPRHYAAHRTAPHGSSARLGRHRWVVERTFAWLAPFRRLTVRHERRADLHLALTTLACAVICLRQIRRVCPWLWIACSSSGARSTSASHEPRSGQGAVRPHPRAMQHGDPVANVGTCSGAQYLSLVVHKSRFMHHDDRPVSTRCGLPSCRCGWLNLAERNGFDDGPHRRKGAVFALHLHARYEKNGNKGG